MLEKGGQKIKSGWKLGKKLTGNGQKGQKRDQKWTKFGKKVNRKWTKIDKKGQKMDKKFIIIRQKRTKVHRRLKMDKIGQKIDKWTKSGHKSVETKSSKCRQSTDKI